jgi:hypothetical protein
MDPDTNLKEQLRLVGIMQDGEPNGDDINHAIRLAELVGALDQWLANGGHLPYRWRCATMRRDDWRPFTPASTGNRKKPPRMATLHRSPQNLTLHSQAAQPTAPLTAGLEQVAPDTPAAPELKSYPPQKLSPP